MGILSSELNYNVVLNDLTNCCLGETSCGTCAKSECLVGYAKDSVTGCLKSSVTYVEDGFSKIPLYDMKLFQTEDLILGIAHILQQCRSCNEEHFNDCIINIMRSCYEVALFGESQAYKGSAFRYLNQINESHPELASQIIEQFHNKNNELK